MNVEGVLLAYACGGTVYAVPIAVGRGLALRIAGVDVLVDPRSIKHNWKVDPGTHYAVSAGYSTTLTLSELVAQEAKRRAAEGVRERARAAKKTKVIR